jgi:hypothetical protein
MSDGATISAPALACDSADFASHCSVMSLSTSPSLMNPQWPWLVYSQLQTSVMISSFGTSCLIARTARCTMPLSSYAPDAISSFGFRQSEQHHPADPQRLHFRAFLDGRVNRHLVVPRHRADLAAHAFPRAHEQWQNKLTGVKPCFPDQVADGFGGPQAPGAVNGVGHHPDCNPVAEGGLDNPCHTVRINLIYSLGYADRL